MDLLNHSKAGLEIETCVYYTHYMNEDFEMRSDEIIWKFYEHLQTCLNQKGLRIVFPHDFENYDDWQLTPDSSIQCPNNKEEVGYAEEEGYLFGEVVPGEKADGLAGQYRINADENDKLSYAPIEIVTSVYQYGDLSNLQKTISSCLITSDFAYGFNSSQGIHYNISNSQINGMGEYERNKVLFRILELMWYLEPMFISFLPGYRQEEVLSGKYCNSLKIVFGDLDNMKANWREFYIKNEDEHEEIDSGNGLFVPKYTIINLKNITEDSTEDVYFEFRLGSAHLIPRLMIAWIKMLSVLVASAIEENIYSQIIDQIKTEDVDQKEALFRDLLNFFGGRTMVNQTLGVIERLRIDAGPGLG